MVVWKCQAKIWGESYGRFTVWVGGMSRKASKSAAGKRPSLTGTAY
jgi:hypothetical protein